MEELWETIKLFIASHRAASIAVASAVGVSAVGAGGYGVYNLVTADNEEIVEVAEVTEEAGSNDVYIPEFVNVVLSSESLEKDITIYISDENDNPITGVPFQVKLLTKEDAESLQSYISAIQDIDGQIAEYVQQYEAGTPAETADAEAGDDSALPVDGEEIDFDKEEKEETEDTADSESSEDSEAKEGVAIEDVASSSDKVTEILQDRNVDVTVTDENGEVVETQSGDISSDPLYLLYLDKETAVQAYTVALNEAAGTVYTDDDSDGVITQTDMEPGDYVLCLVNDLESEVNYEPEGYATAAEVKDKVEYKVQKEITKQIKKDEASEDGQKAAAAEVPVENKLTDTVEYVESKKVESGGNAKGTTDVVAPKDNSSASKAALKSGSTKKSSIAHKVKIVTTAPATEEKKDTNTGGSTSDSGTGSSTGGNTGDSGSGSSTGGTTDQGGSTTTPTTPSTGTDTTTGGSTGQDSGTTDQGSGSTGNTGSSTDQGTSTDTNTNNSTGTDTGTGDGNTTPTTFRRTRTGGAVAASFNTFGSSMGFNAILSATNTTTQEIDASASLDMTYSGGTFTINSSVSDANYVSITDIKVNGAAASGTYKVTKDGDYTLTGTAKFKDDYTEAFSVTYTVSGFGTASTTDVLKDSAGHELYLDEACTKKATAADYEKGKTYYYKEATYTYYGWQSIDGNTYYFDKNGNKVTGTQVIQGVQYDFGTDGVLANKGTGIDVSKYQGKIDWAQAKSAVNFAIIRCGYRGMYDGQLHEDPYFYTNMSGAKGNGVSVGVYIYSTALNEAEAVQEASMAVAMAQKAGGCSYPIYIDMEDKTRGQSSLSTAQRMAILNAFVSTVQSSGYKAGVYCSKNWMTSLMDANSVPGSCSVWIAQYNTSCTYGGRKNMWQYSSKGSVPGIKGYVDMDKSF
ncbi:MAG: hypothetical protein K6F66_02345 [Pseudobutyrivibrio sp.]|nr:hypothetical protein [Pseudobutyrivibrio sp.]